jgi:hypothetical protein
MTKTDIFYLGVVGSRTFNNYALCEKTLDKVLKRLLDKHEQVIFVSGGAKGADFFAKKYAKEHKIKIIEFLPDWDKHGKSAGFIRNQEIIDKSDLLVAFWDGQSRGTYHDIKLMNIKSLAHIKGAREFTEDDVKYLNKVIIIRF